MTNVTQMAAATSRHASERFFSPGQPSGLMTWIAAMHNSRNSIILLVTGSHSKADFGSS